MNYLKTIYKYLQKFILGAFILYSYNMIAVNFNMIIPINLWTVLFVSIFDFPALVTLVILKVWGV